MLYLLITFLFVVGCDMQGSPVLVVGHRGACGYEPENTLLSFKKALEIGVDIVEFDVQKSADGQLVIVHDGTVDRTTDGTGLVAEKSFKELRKLNAGKGQTIPTLHEVLDCIDKKARVNIEIKASEVVEKLAHVIKEYLTKGWKLNDFLVSSFDLEELKKFHRLLPDISLMAIFSKLSPDWLTIVKEIPAQMVAISSRSISKEIIQQAHSHDIKVIVYTVNEPQEIAYMKALGVDGICSNYPDRVKSSSTKF